MWKLADNRVSFVTIDPEYLDWLRQFETRIYMEHPGHRPRPFMGVLVCHEDIHYVIPMSSRKEKYLKMRPRADMVKIEGGELGVLNLNEAFPVPDWCIHPIDIASLIHSENLADQRYGRMLNKQYRQLRKKETREEILCKFKALYDSYMDGSIRWNQKKVCCSFPKLEKVYRNYGKNRMRYVPAGA